MIASSLITDQLWTALCTVYSVGAVLSAEHYEVLLPGLGIFLL